MSFSVLFVCTGNICRSPAAELLFRARIGDVPITASSAGTSGLSGHEMDAPSAHVVERLGADPSAHIARRLTAAMIADSDLIVTAASTHRSAVIQLVPLAFRRTFTMREFARLGRDSSPLATPVTYQVLRDRVAWIADRRGSVDPAEPGGDDIGDPFGAGYEAAEVAITAVSDAVDGIVQALGLLRVSTAS